MADKIYRLVYYFPENPVMRFSDWVRLVDIDSIIEDIQAVNPPDADSPGGVSPVLHGMQEMEIEDLED